MLSIWNETTQVNIINTTLGIYISHLEYLIVEQSRQFGYLTVEDTGIYYRI